jgi:hypothetical protein
MGADFMLTYSTSTVKVVALKKKAHINNINLPSFAPWFSMSYE